MLKKLLLKNDLTRDDLLYLISLDSDRDLHLLYQAAYEVKTRWVGRKAYYRGLIELSNVCTKNCLYCGIRSDNQKVRRFSMTREEIIALVRWADQKNYGSVTLQSGERNDEIFVEFIDDLLLEISRICQGRLGITLCLGEQSEMTYKRWRQLGAHRYLLRMETSSPDLYGRIHPTDRRHDYEYRRECLRILKRNGYQVGTGVMIGLPGQSPESLVDDILFYKQMGVDMIGMGPYIVHHDTPLGREVMAQGLDSAEHRRQRLEYSLKMIALTRLFLKNINIAATTALQALDPLGREKGLLAGANILMPIITSKDYRHHYLLYNQKPCVDDDPDKCRHCLSGRVRSIGEEVGFGQRGDSPHYFDRAET